jgi:hypothetical protein
MPDTQATDYITKTEAARLYQRSERSISRDITNAVKFGDGRVLQHVELRLEDGTRRPGTELTIEEIVDLRDRGLNPTWLLQTVWLRTAYGLRGEPPVGASIDLPDSLDSSADHLQPLPEDLEQRAAVLAAQNDALRQSNADLRNQAERLEKELDRRAEERREENELQKQNNVLMQQVYNLLSQMQESSGPLQVLAAPRPVKAASQSPTIDADQVRKDTPVEHADTKVTRKNKAARSKSIPQPRKLSRNQKTRPATLRKRPPVSKPEPTRFPTDRLHRWFPTFLGARRGPKK